MILVGRTKKCLISNSLNIQKQEKNCIIARQDSGEYAMANYSPRSSNTSKYLLQHIQYRLHAQKNK